MRNQTKSLNKLLLSKVKIASVNEQQMVVGGGERRRKRQTQSKTGDTRQQQSIGILQTHVDAFEYI